MIKFPCLGFKENRVILSREEMMDKMAEAVSIGKSCEVGIYAFSEWYNMDPVEESVILDKIVLKGERPALETVAEEKLKKGIESTLIFDGFNYLLFVFEEMDSVQSLDARLVQGVEVIKNLKWKFTVPGHKNLRTGQMSTIVRKWKISG